MKRYASLALLGLISASAQAGVSVLKPMTPAYELNVSALYLKPSTTNYDYAILTNPFPLPSPDWTVQTLNPDHDWGFNVGARFISRHARDVQLNWMHLRTNDSASVSANSSQFIGAFYQVGPNAGEIRQSKGSEITQFDVVNLDGGQLVQFGKRLETRMFVGLSGAFLKEELSASFWDNDSSFYLRSDQTSKFNGAGPRVGMSFEYGAYRCIGLVGQLAGAVLVGKMQPSMTFTSASDALLAQDIVTNYQSIVTNHSTQVVPSLDGKLGINYRYRFASSNQMTFELGFQAATFINAILAYEPGSLVEPLEDGTIPLATLDKTTSSISNSGPYLNFAYRF